MALTILSQPDLITSLYSIDGDNLSFVLESTESALCSMKYVGDLYVNGNYVTRIKNSPNLVDGKCVMLFNKVIEDFVTSDRNSTYFEICENSTATYSILFGEETDGTYDCSGSSFDIIYGPSYSGSVWNGTIQYGEDFDPLDWLVTTGGNVANFLTNSPDEQSIYISESAALWWITGETMSQCIEINVSNDVNPDATWYIFYVDMTPGVMLSVGSGPADLNYYVTNGVVVDIINQPAVDPIITCDTITYSVQVIDFPVTSIPRTDPKIYEVLCDCNTWTPFQIVWLNKRGGYDNYTFRLKSTRTITNEKKEWSRYLSTLQSNNTFGYNIGDRGRSVYSSRAFETVTVVSTWMTAAEHNWVAELFESQEVYYRPSPGFEIPVVVGNKSVEIKNKQGIGNRMLSHTIEFTYANERVNQRG